VHDASTANRCGWCRISAERSVESSGEVFALTDRIERMGERLHPMRIAMLDTVPIPSIAMRDNIWISSITTLHKEVRRGQDRECRRTPAGPPAAG
jgi:hypothetical protein